MQKRLDVLASIAVIAASVVVLANKVQTWTTPRTAPPYAVGDKIAETADLRFGSTTYLLFTASTCHFCTESLPFYRKLTQTGVRLVATTAEPVEVNQQYLASNGVNAERILSASANGLKFRNTPSLLLVDSSGVVKSAWWGRQRPEIEDQILKGVEK